MQENMEKVLPSAEEEEMEELQSEEEGVEETEEKDDIEEGENGDEEEDGGDDKDQKAEAKPQVTGEKIPNPAQVKANNQPGVLNLNNEVVKMRKEVKRVRALIIRKMTRQIAALKKKKGKEAEVERNQRRAARLLEEVHALKELVPDLVTKTALQRNLNFDKVCQNPKSTISDRALARLASHPQFSKKITDIKAAVKAFKDERMKGGKLVQKEKMQKQVEKVTPQASENRGERDSEENRPKPEKVIESEVGAVVLKGTEDVTVVPPEKEIEEGACSGDKVDKVPESTSVKPVVVKISGVKDPERNKLQAVEKKPDPTPVLTVVQGETDEEERDLEVSDEEESDLELSGDEEKEYFDDSTEERFHKQSSQSEESDDDDFFLGKVSKFKKKKKKDEEEQKKGELKKGSTDNNVKSSDKLQSQLDELESRLKSKAMPLQSVFCPSLSRSKPDRGASRGRGGDRFRGQGKPKGGSGPNRDFSKQSKDPASKYSKPFPEGGRQKEFGSAGRGRGGGRGRGRGDNHRAGGGGFSHQAPQQTLHPSWEASKKRKEQQGQILAFQGKKIKFDDSD